MNATKKGTTVITVPDCGTEHRTAAMAGRNQNPHRGGRRPNHPSNVNQGEGRGRRRVRGARAPGNAQVARAHATDAGPTIADEADERDKVHAVIDSPGARNQYAVIQNPASHQGVSFELLIDCGSTHSFLSPKCLRKLKLNQLPKQGR